MSSDGARQLRFEQALAAGDLAAVREILGHREGFPNVQVPFGSSMTLLDEALTRGSVALVRGLLEQGADPEAERVDDGFPPLVNVLHHERDRDRRLQLLRLLLDHGADPNRRGLFTATPLHFAVAALDAAAIRLLLERGADPTLATTIDDYETPLEQAERTGFAAGVALLREHSDQHAGGQREHEGDRQR